MGSNTLNKALNRSILLNVFLIIGISSCKRFETVVSNTNEINIEDQNLFIQQISNVDTFYLECGSSISKIINRNYKASFFFKNDLSCCIIDSVFEGNKFYIDLVVDYIERLDPTLAMGQLACSQASTDLLKSYRGEKIFNVLIKKLLDNIDFFECWTINNSGNSKGGFLFTQLKSMIKNN